MEGLELLSVRTVTENPEGLIFGGSVLILFAIILLIISLCTHDTVSFIFFLICLIGSMGCFIAYEKTPTVEYEEYKVTMGVDVKYEDFISRYIVISSEGKIYTIKERTLEEENK